MGKNKIIVEISPSRLQVAVVRGRSVIASRCRRVNTVGYAERWPRCVDDFAGPLAELIAELEASGSTATVLYAGPTASTGVFSCSAKAGTNDALESARLALAESAEFALESNPHDLAAIGTDALIKKEPGDAPLQRHTLGTADSEAVISAIGNLMTAVGVIPESIIPANAPMLAAVVEQCLASSRQEPDRVMLALYAGEHGSALAGAFNGRLKFVREVSLGTETLSDAFSRASASEASPGLGVARAAELLQQFGIPSRDQVLDEATGLSGARILPLIQPVLQRLVVEIKQSLRFGIEAKDRQQPSIVGIGQIASIPRLLEVIAEQAGAKAAPLATAQTPAAPGVSGLYLAARYSIGMLPRAICEREQSRQVRHALWVGVAATLGLIGLDAWSTMLDLRQERSTLAALEHRLEAATPAQTMYTRLKSLRSALELANAARIARFDGAPDTRGVMNMLAAHTPDTIKLSQVQITSEGGKPICRVTGRAVASSGVDPDSAVRAYVDSLSGVPIVEGSRLGQTRRGTGTSGEEMQTFDLTLTLVALPASIQTASAASSPKVGEQ